MDDLLCPGLFIFIVIIATVIISNNNNEPVRTRSRRASNYKKYKRRNKKTIYIYKLMDGKKPFYVGQTVNPNRRLTQHLNDYTWSDKSRYIMNMTRIPHMVVITQTDNKTKANQLENKYIRMWGKTNMKWA